MQNNNNAEGQSNAHPPVDNTGSNPGKDKVVKIELDVEVNDMETRKNKFSSLVMNHF